MSSVYCWGSEMSLNLSCCLLLNPCLTKSDTDVRTARCPQETHSHCCSNVIVYTRLSKGNRVFEDAAGFDFLHGQGLPLEIQNRYTISHLHIHSGRMRVDLPHPVYFHQKAYCISDLRDNLENCLYRHSYIGQTLWRLRVIVLRLMLVREGHFTYNRSWGNHELWNLCVEIWNVSSLWCRRKQINHVWLITPGMPLKAWLSAGEKWEHSKDDFDLLRDPGQINHSVTSSWQSHIFKI